jgi:hypothetical protein
MRLGWSLIYKVRAAWRELGSFTYECALAAVLIAKLLHSSGSTVSGSCYYCWTVKVTKMPVTSDFRANWSLVHPYQELLDDSLRDEVQLSRHSYYHNVTSKFKIRRS